MEAVTIDLVTCHSMTKGVLEFYCRYPLGIKEGPNGVCFHGQRDASGNDDIELCMNGDHKTLHIFQAGDRQFTGTRIGPN